MGVCPKRGAFRLWPQLDLGSLVMSSCSGDVQSPHSLRPMAPANEIVPQRYYYTTPLWGIGGGSSNSLLGPDGGFRTQQSPDVYTASLSLAFQTLTGKSLK